MGEFGSKVEKFEDLKVWQLTRELVRCVYSVTTAPAVARDYGFIDQIRRAVVSIMNNIAEGFERGSNRDFVKFLFIVKASAGEVRSLLYVALDQGYIGAEEFDRIYDMCTQVSSLLVARLESAGDARRSESGCSNQGQLAATQQIRYSQVAGRGEELPILFPCRTCQRPAVGNPCSLPRQHSSRQMSANYVGNASCNMRARQHGVG
jgi:four helix bundle protein